MLKPLKSLKKLEVKKIGEVFYYDFPCRIKA